MMTGEAIVADEFDAGRALSPEAQRTLCALVMAGIFSERAILSVGVDLKLFYLILLLCLPVLFWIWNFALPRGYFLAWAYLWSSGLVCLALGTVKLEGLASEGTGITICSLFYLLFFRTQGKPVELLFARYAGIAFWVSLAGFPIAAFETAMRGSMQPVRSILLEPAHFCQVVMPAMFYYASHASRSRRDRVRMLVILLAIVCSLSSTGILALMLGAVLLLRGRRLGLLLIPLVLVPVMVTTYSVSDHFRLRVEDSVSGLVSSDLTGVNLSTYTLLSNLYVTRCALADHPLFGTGLGSFEQTHAKYIGSLPGVESFLGSYAYDANAKDANSLLLRIATEFGFVGLGGVAFLLIRYRASSEPRYGAMSYAALLYLFMKLFREGHYFSPEMYFFVWIYVFSSARFHDGVNSIAPRHGLNLMRCASFSAATTEMH